jgi:acetamidase/formamidase
MPTVPQPRPRIPVTHALALIAAGVLFTLPAAAIEVGYDYHVPLTPENAVLGAFPVAKKPVITVPSGAIVRIDGGGGARGTGTTAGEDAVALTDAFLKENGIDLTVAKSPALQETIRVRKETVRIPGVSGGHLLVGPIAIEGAEPGDMLEVRILDVTPRIPFGTTGGTPGRGALALGSAATTTTPATPSPAVAATAAPGAAAAVAADAPRPFSKVTKLDLKRNAGVFSPDIEVPLAPFMGVMATTPPDSEGPNRSSTAPGVFGGNLDCSELTAGSTLYLPVFQKGAGFFTGDSHAVQGDGEVTGTAIETADVCTLQFILHKNVKLTMPRAETPTHYIVFGLDPDLNLAMKQAAEEANKFLQEKQNIDVFQAYSLSSMAVDFRVTQVVDRTLGIHAMIPKKLFIKDTDHYWYRAL